MYTYSKSLYCGIWNDAPLVNSCPFDMLQDGQANRPKKNKTDKNSSYSIANHFLSCLIHMYT